MVTRWTTKPRWQHRDARTRLAAVLHDDDAALQAQLPVLAVQDPDAGVRTAALRRIADIALVQTCAFDDADATVREAAQVLYRDLLGGNHPASPPLTERLRMLRVLDDRALREHLARHAAEPELREAALSGSIRPGLLTECILNDPDPALRLRLLDRIDDADSLQRIAKQARRHDKQVSQIASQRVMARRVAAGDADAITECAEQCCLRLEQATAQGREARAAALADTDALWQSLGGAAYPSLATRYTHIRAQLEAINAAADAPPRGTATPAPPTPPREAEPIHPSARVDAEPLDARRLAAEARFQASVAEGSEHAPARHEPVPPPVDVSALLDAMESALERGDLAAARSAEQAIEQLPASARQGKLAARWQQARVRSSELQGWQRWSTRRQRRQLCADAEGLQDAGLHPDALSTRVRELRSAWQTLDSLEGGEPGGADVALKRRFNGLCQRAMAAAKPYFKARDALRSQHTQDIRALLDESNAALAGAEQPDWRQLEVLRKRLQATLRDLDSSEPAARKALAGALHKHLRQFDARLGEHHAAIQAAHEKLIAQAQALAENTDATTPARVRELQAQWKVLGPGRRDRDHKQWRSFRAACDAIFAQRDEARDAAKQREQADNAQARQLIEQLRQAAGSDNTTHDDVQRLRRDTAMTWRTLAPTDRALSQAWRGALAAVDDRLTALKRAAMHAQFEQAFKATDASEAGDTRPVLAAALRQRPTTPADPDSARDVLVRCEALAGVDSPAEDQERRVALRLQRLQATLGAGERRSRSDELEAVLADWIGLGPMPAEAANLHARMQHALAIALQQL